MGRAMQLGAEAAEVAVAEVVHEDDNDVRFGFRRDGREADGQRQKREKGFHGWKF